MANVQLKAVSRTQGNNQALKDGTVKPKHFDLVFEEVPVLPEAFRRMVRGNEFDVCEMALTTYICAKSFGKPFTAIPVFIVRQFHHGVILYNTDSGIRTPKDLEGKRVGVNRGYTVTAGVWARSILQEEYGVDLSTITWVLSGDEHVQEWQRPANVVPVEKGKTVGDMLASGELVAAIGIDTEAPNVKPLIPHAQEAGLAALTRSGHYPINHTVVIKDELLEKYPNLAAEMFDAFAESKRLYMQRLTSGQITKPTAIDELHLKVKEIIGDPLPYCVEPNRHTIEELMRHAMIQGIITKPLAMEQLFAKGTLNLTA